MMFANKNLLKRDLTFILLIGTLFLVLELTHQSWFCPFFDGIGIPCPGCGFTSATKALLRGDIQAAYFHHPLVFLAPFGIVYYIYTRYILPSIPSWDKGVLIFVLVLFFIIYILRLFGIMPMSAVLTFNKDALLPRIFSFVF